MATQFRSFLIAAVLCFSVPMAPSLSGQEGPDGPRRGGPNRNGPERNVHNGPHRSGANGVGPGFRGLGSRGSDMRRPMGPGFGRPDSRDAKSRGNVGGPQRPTPHRSGPKEFGPRFSKQANGGE